MASRNLTVHPLAVTTGLLLSLLLATPAAADNEGFISIPDLPELQDRVSAFRQALREITIEPEPSVRALPARSGDLLSLESRFRASESLERASLDEHPGIPYQRDVAFEEQWLLAGREDEHERAARHWIGRQLKGSDLRGHRGGGSRWKLKSAWDHGPMLGVGRGNYSVRAGEGQWRVQWSKRWSRSNGPWAARVWVGEDDGDFTAQFLIGRSLLDAYGRRR